MGETWSVLGETWRRFWRNPLVWALPVGGWLGTFVLMFVLMIFLILGPLGVLLDLAAFFLYGALLLAGLIAACAAVATKGQAAWEDVRDGGKRFFGPACGLMGIGLGLSFGVSMLLSATLMPGMVGEFATSVADGAFPAGDWFLRFFAVGLAASLAMSVLLTFLLGFAPAAVGLERIGSGAGLGRGLRFVGRRFGLSSGILLAGILVCLVLPTLPGIPGFLSFARALPGLLESLADQAASLGAGASGAIAPGAILPQVFTLQMPAEFAPFMEHIGWMNLYGLLAVVFEVLAMPFFLLGTFVAYARHSGTALRGQTTPGGED